MDMLKMIFGTSKPESTPADNFTEFARTHNARHAQKQKAKGKKS